MLEIPLLPGILREWSKGQTATDTVDRLNYFITTSIICFFALITSAKQFFGKPIQCWMSAEFEGGWEQYVEDYCFISKVYVQPDDQQFTHRSQLTNNVRHTDHASYYPWIPIVLCLQAMCFYFPHFFWKFVQKRTAIYPEAFLKEAEKLNELTGDTRALELNRLTDYYMETVSMFGTASISRRIPITPRSGRNATLLYLLTKIFYLFNIYAQIYMLSQFIGESYLHWGFESFFGILRGLQWKESAIFPRVVFCDFTIRRLGNLNAYTTQCVLMMNMINEKLYLFLFVWFTILTMATLADFIYYVLILTVPRFRKDLVLRTVDGWRRGVSGTNKRDIVDRFVDECLHPDGVLLLLFLSDHVGGRITYDLTNAMITRYNTEEGPVYKHSSNMSQAPSVCPEESDESCIVNVKGLLPTVTPFTLAPPLPPHS